MKHNWEIAPTQYDRSQKTIEIRKRTKKQKSLKWILKHKAIDF